METSKILSARIKGKTTQKGLLMEQEERVKKVQTREGRERERERDRKAWAHHPKWLVSRLKATWPVRSPSLYSEDCKRVTLASFFFFGVDLLQ